MSDVQRHSTTGRIDRKAPNSRFRRPPATTPQAERLAAADRSLTEAQASVRATGVDPDFVKTAFAVARDCLAEASECSTRAQQELAFAQRERVQAHRERLNATQYPDTAADPVVPDVPGSDLCPNPSAVRTSADLM